MLMFGRDPFARETRTRRSIRPAPSQPTCAWCGGVKKTKRGIAFLYIYGVEPDAGRPSEDRAAFCCVSCRDAYYGR